MKAAHKDFHITEKEWQSLMIDFRASLAKFKVPGAEQKEDRDRREHQGGYGHHFCPKEVSLRAKPK
jgi:hypothetical protein